MKAAFPVTGDDLGSPLDARFGRSAKLLVYDMEGGGFEIIDNSKNLDAVQGAGIQSAEAVVRAGAGILMAGHCGPKAFRVLRAAGVKVYLTQAPTVAAALEEYRAGRLVEASASDVEGHWT